MILKPKKNKNDRLHHLQNGQKQLSLPLKFLNTLSYEHSNLLEPATTSKYLSTHDIFLKIKNSYWLVCASDGLIGLHWI